MHESRQDADLAQRRREGPVQTAGRPGSSKATESVMVLDSELVILPRGRTRSPCPDRVTLITDAAVTLRSRWYMPA